MGWCGELTNFAALPLPTNRAHRGQWQGCTFYIIITSSYHQETPFIQGQKQIFCFVFFEDVFSRMKAYQAERKFLYFEKRHFLFLSRMSFLCMRRSDPQERRSRTLKTGIDFKPNSKTFRYILNHNNNKKLRKLCLSRFCACSAIPTCLLSDIKLILLTHVEFRLRMLQKTVL